MALDGSSGKTAMSLHCQPMYIAAATTEEPEPSTTVNPVKPLCTVPKVLVHDPYLLGGNLDMHSRLGLPSIVVTMSQVYSLMMFEQDAMITHLDEAHTVGSIQRISWL